jgi:hypothetical protein
MSNAPQIKLVELLLTPEEPYGRLQMRRVARPLGREHHDTLVRSLPIACRAQEAARTDRPGASVL